MRVLEKCGYLLEGISRQAVWKNGQFLDLHQYAFVRDEGRGTEGLHEGRGRRMGLIMLYSGTGPGLQGNCCLGNVDLDPRS